MAILLEADFLTVDLNSITASKSPSKEQNNDLADAGPITDWEGELSRRLENNKKLDPGARESDYEVEIKFFDDYFAANWKPECAKQLATLGDPIRKAIKVLGFDSNVNPILAFISDPFVQTALIKTKLLNIETFKAIYNAVAKKLVAHSQFLKANTYNIIYCPDLYKKSATEIIEYLSLQDDILPANASKYTKADLDKNKKVFLDLPEATEKVFSKRIAQIEALDASKSSVQTLKLNSIELATELENKLGDADATPRKTQRLNTESQEQLIQKLDTPEKKVAAILFLSMTTQSRKAKDALLTKKLASIPSDKLIKASTQITRQMPKIALATKDADSLVELILDTL